MKYCQYCGKEVNENQDVCLNCGKTLNNSKNMQSNNSDDGTVAICAIIGLLIPIVGAILYYVFKNSNPKAAKTANVCSWIGFLLWGFGGLLLFF